MLFLSFFLIVISMFSSSSSMDRKVISQEEFRKLNTLVALPSTPHKISLKPVLTNGNNSTCLSLLTERNGAVNLIKQLIEAVKTNDVGLVNSLLEQAPNGLIGGVYERKECPIEGSYTELVFPFGHAETDVMREILIQSHGVRFDDYAFQHWLKEKFESKDDEYTKNICRLFSDKQLASSMYFHQEKNRFKSCRLGAYLLELAIETGNLDSFNILIVERKIPITIKLKNSTNCLHHAVNIHKPYFALQILKTAQKNRDIPSLLTLIRSVDEKKLTAVDLALQKVGELLPDNTQLVSYARFICIFAEISQEHDSFGINKLNAAQRLASLVHLVNGIHFTEARLAQSPMLPSQDGGTFSRLPVIQESEEWRAPTTPSRMSEFQTGPVGANVDA